MTKLKKLLNKKRLYIEVIGLLLLQYLNFDIAMFSFIFPIILVGIFLSHFIPFLFKQIEEGENKEKKEESRYVKFICYFFIFPTSIVGFSFLLYIVFTLYQTVLYGYYLFGLSLFSFFNGITIIILLFILSLRYNRFSKHNKKLALIVKVIVCICFIISSLLIFYSIFILLQKYQYGIVYKVANILGILLILLSYYLEIMDIGNRIVDKNN